MNGTADGRTLLFKGPGRPWIAGARLHPKRRPSRASALASRAVLMRSRVAVAGAAGGRPGAQGRRGSIARGRGARLRGDRPLCESRTSRLNERGGGSAFMTPLTAARAFITTQACRKPYDVALFMEAARAARVVRCDVCSDPIKPGTIFFGEPLPPAFFAHATKVRAAMHRPLLLPLLLLNAKRPSRLVLSRRTWPRATCCSSWARR